MAIRPQFYCVKCGRHKDKKEFYLNYNKYLKEYNDGRMLYCSSCCKEISQNIMKDYTSFELGLRNVCTFFCMPVVEGAISKLKDLYESKSKEPDWNWVAQYGAVLKDLGINDNYWNNLTGNSVVFDDTFKQLKENELEVMTEFYKLWGNRTLREYEFLEHRWQKYTDGLKLTTAQASLYRQLCIQELEIRNKETNKESSKDVKEAQGELMKLMTKLGIDKFVSNDKSNEERMFEAQIEYIERTEPAEHYKDLEKFKDYRGIGEYFDNHVKRPFRNLLMNSKDYKILNQFVDDARTNKPKRKKK